MKNTAQSTHQLNHELALNPCNLCDSLEAAELSLQGRKGNALRTVVCKNCGLVWADPLPHNARVFYQVDYRVAYKGTFKPKPKHIIRAGKVALARRNVLNTWLTKPLKILDVGSGGGEFAYLLKSQGHEVCGIEPNKGYAAFSRQEYALEILESFIQDIQQPENAYDLITIWHVLEHTEDPCAVLDKLYSLLKPEGILVVEVPSIEATCQSPKNTFHDAHIYHFNLATLRKLGEKVGFFEVAHSMAHDGANITVFFQKPNHEITVAKVKTLQIPGNAEKIISLVTQHTTIKYYLTWIPYQRFVDRIGRLLGEKLTERAFSTGKAFLDQLYSS